MKQQVLLSLGNQLIDKLEKERELSKDEYVTLLGFCEDPIVTDCLFQKARQVSHQNVGNKIYTRGLIEISNYCKNDCLYCGIRKSNRNVDRYRLTKKQILNCCAKGYELGFRTFVLQGGEDPYFTEEILVDIITQIREKYMDCAITLSLGEHSEETYRKLFLAGGTRYLLRHETINEHHYALLHPPGMTIEKRKKCLEKIKEIGFQTGCGIMIGSPFQTDENIAEDLEFIKNFDPEMVGVGPFIPQRDTPFADKKRGSLEKTLMVLSIIRLMLPKVLLPSTTALGTIKDGGREAGVLAGANVVMPNLSPIEVRKKYMLYDNKISTGEEAAESWHKLQEKMEAIGYRLVVERGDYKET